MEGSIVKIHRFLFLWSSWSPVTSFFQVGDASGGGNSFISLVFESNSWSRMPTTLMCGFGFHQRDFTSFSLLGRITHTLFREVRHRVCITCSRISAPILSTIPPLLCSSIALIADSLQSMFLYNNTSTLQRFYKTKSVSCSPTFSLISSLFQDKSSSKNTQNVHPKSWRSS